MTKKILGEGDPSEAAAPLTSLPLLFSKSCLDVRLKLIVFPSVFIVYFEYRYERMTSKQMGEWLIESSECGIGVFVFSLGGDMGQRRALDGRSYGGIGG